MGARADKRQFEENDRARQWQSAENQLAREHNQMLAEQQNKWNIEQWNRENEYNSPAAQMKRFAAAGLNPNALLGNMSNAPQLSGSLTSGQGYSPVDFSSTFDHGIADRAVSKGRNLSSAFEQLGDNLMQIPAYKEQVEGMRIDNDIKRQNLYEQKTTAPARIQGIELNNQHLKASADNLQRSTALLEEKAAEIRSHTKNMDADTALKKIQQVLQSNESVARIRQMEASTKLSHAECTEILTLLPAQLLGYKLENDNLYKYGIKVDAETKQIQFDYRSDLEWKDQERTLNAWDYIIGYARDIASIAGTFFGGNYSETMTNSVKDGVQTVTRTGKRN